MLRTWPNTISHEELFIERYAQLVQWSLKLANGDRQLAEDLVHDAFIQFTLGRPDLDGIRNLDGYLYTTLRNRLLSHVRRSARSPLDRLSAVDYDSAEISLRASDPRTLMLVHEELYLICRYGCERKETSKAGSVLILRFIHAYYPAEIALIMKGTRKAVDIWIRLARSEARLYVESPRSLSTLESGAAEKNPKNGTFVRDDDVLIGLRRETLSYRDGDCPSAKRLKELYSRNGDSVNCKLLAHFASCPPCLEAVGSLLGLAPPADRYPTDKPGPSFPSGKSRRRDVQQKTSLRRAEEVFEQRPGKLIVSVNGFFIGSQVVSSEISELTLSVHVDERIGFVDILSEQGLLLLALNVDPPPEGSVEHVARIELSGGRSLEAALNFLAARPTLDVVYRDPHFQETAATTIPDEDTLHPAVLGSESGNEASHLPRRRHQPRYRAFLEWVSQSLNPGFWLKPGVLTAMLAAILAISLFFYTGTRGVSASQLVAQAELAERALLNEPGTVIHRSIDLEARNASSGTHLSRKRVELWQTSGSEATSHRVLRLYDESGRLEAGEWTLPDGSRRLYRNGHTSAVNPPIEQFPADGDEVWRLDLSARGFSAIVGDLANARVDQRATTFVISYAGRDGAGRTGLLSAGLTVAKSDLHVVGQRFVVKRGTEQIEYVFNERGFERLPAASAPPNALQPDVDMTGQESPRRPDVSAQPSDASAVTIPGNLAASADLEVEVAYLLDQANATTGEQVALTRVPDGRLLVSGIVETDRRKSEILEALRPVSSNRAVRIDLSTVAEAMKRSTPSSKGTTQKFDLSDSSTVPIYAELHAYFERRGLAGEQIDAEVNRLSTRVLSLSRNAVGHAWALRRLGDQFKPDAAHGLSPAAQEKRLSMLREHAAALRKQAETLRSELQAIFGASPTTFEESSQIKDEMDLMHAIDNIAQQSSANDRAIQSAFTISTNGGQVSNLRSPRFFEALRRIESLATRIAEFNR
jgi:DNA-directed RNA polymerase specialized sigma24 family protein